MRSVSTIALGVALALGGAAGLGAPAAAQKEPHIVSEFSPQERSTLLALQTAIETKNYAAAASALSAAQSAARSGKTRYLASALQLRLGLETANIPLQSSAIDGMIGSGAVPAAELPLLYRNQAALLHASGKLDRAETALARYTELAPNDPEGLIALAQVKADRKKVGEALPLLARAIAARRAAGQPVPESWYRRGASLALMHQLTPQALPFARDLAAAYPTPINWRDAVMVYRDVVRPDPEAAIDSWRLARATRALAGERDYLQFAQALSNAGLAAEAKAVLDEGVSARMVNPAKPTFKELITASGKAATSARAGLKARETAAMAAPTGTNAASAGDAFLAAGDYAKAAALYRAALTKGGVDPNVVNTRLGIALASMGQKAEAEVALRTVTGPRAELASLWLAHLAQRA
jgi:tetratricopeptide (TPR) repeat protein